MTTYFKWHELSPERPIISDRPAKVPRRRMHLRIRSLISRPSDPRRMTSTTRGKMDGNGSLRRIGKEAACRTHAASGRTGRSDPNVVCRPGNRYVSRRAFCSSKAQRRFPRRDVSSRATYGCAKCLARATTKGSGLAGAQSLATSLRQWAEVFRRAEDVRFQVKVTGIHFDGATATTSQLMSVTARFDSYRLEQHAKWDVTWRRPGTNELPRLASLRIEDFEQTTAQCEQRNLLADCTVSMLGENACFQSQLLRGYGSLLGRMQDSRYFVISSNPGLAIGDVNGDGLDDVFVGQEEGLPNLLFVQQPDGTAANRADEWGVDWLHNSRGALLVDWDNDGDQDLAVSVLGGVIVASNEGTRFEVRTFLPTRSDTMSLAAADYDIDADWTCLSAPM